MLILKYERGRVPKKKGRGEHPAKSAGRSLLSKASLGYNSRPQVNAWASKVENDHPVISRYFDN